MSESVALFKKLFIYIFMYYLFINRGGGGGLGSIKSVCAIDLVIKM